MVYSVVYSISELWHNGMEPLAVVLFLFSGVLPYTKLFMMMLSWGAPTRWISTKWRGRMLLVTDQIGKFSLVDIFVVQYISGCMFTVIDLSTDSAGLGPLSVVLRTPQEEGFVYFTLATVGSLICGHICLYYHEEDPLTKLEHAVTTDKELPSRFLNEPHSVAEIDEMLTGKKKTYVGPVLIIMGTLALFGFCLPAFTVALESPVGILSETRYSLLSFTYMLPHLDKYSSSFAARFSQLTYLLFALIFLQVHMCILLMVWFAKVKPKMLSTSNMLAHSLFAWSATDVALMSMVLTLLEMSNANLVPLDSMLDPTLSSIYKAVTGMDHVPNKGVALNVVIGPGVWILMFAVVLHAWIGRVVMSVLENAVESQEAVAPHPECVTLQHVRGRTRAITQKVRGRVSTHEDMGNEVSKYPSFKADDMEKQPTVELAELRK